MTDSVLARVRLKVEPLEFNETLPDMVFFVRDVGRDKVWHDVFAYMGKDPAEPRLVMARTGTVRLFPEERRAILELADGPVYSGPPAAPGEDTLTTFERLEEEIDVAGPLRGRLEREAGQGKGHRRARPRPPAISKPSVPPDRPSHDRSAPTGSRSTRSSPCRPPASCSRSSACRSGS